MLTSGAPWVNRILNAQVRVNIGHGFRLLLTALVQRARTITTDPEIESERRPTNVSPWAMAGAVD
jgi:hypothetical protein